MRAQSPAGPRSGAAVMVGETSAGEQGPGSRGVPDQRGGPQDLERPQDALLTGRTALDVDASEAQHERSSRLRGSGRRGRLRQQRPTLCERCRPAAIGEQAEVADANEAVGDHVEQEAPEELARLR